MNLTPAQSKIAALALSSCRFLSRLGFHETRRESCGSEIVVEYRNAAETAAYRAHVLFYRDGCGFLLRWHKLEDRRLSRVWFDLRDVTVRDTAIRGDSPCRARMPRPHRKRARKAAGLFAAGA